MRTIEEMRAIARERYRKKHGVTPDRYANGRSHPENREYYKQVNQRYYQKHKEAILQKKKEYYIKKRLEKEKKNAELRSMQCQDDREAPSDKISSGESP